MSVNFQPKTPLYCPTRIHSGNFPGNLHGPSRSHTQLPPKHTCVIFTQPHSFFKIYPNTSPSTHPSSHPSQYPAITPSTCPTLTPSHTWAISVRFGRPHRLHCTCIQGWIPLPGPFPDAFVYPVVRRGQEEIINPPTHISFISLSLWSVYN